MCACVTGSTLVPVPRARRSSFCSATKIHGWQRYVQALVANRTQEVAGSSPASYHRKLQLIGRLWPVQAARGPWVPKTRSRHDLVLVDQASKHVTPPHQRRILADHAKAPRTHDRRNQPNPATFRNPHPAPRQLFCCGNPRARPRNPPGALPRPRTRFYVTAHRRSSAQPTRTPRADPRSRRTAVPESARPRSSPTIITALPSTRIRSLPARGIGSWPRWYRRRQAADTRGPAVGSH